MISLSANVIEIFESPYTDQLNDRKASSIIQFSKQRREGFYYEELPNLIKIMEYCVKDLIDENVEEMEQAIACICECATFNFKKNKASDELEYVPLIPKFLNTFRPLLVSHQITREEIKSQVSHQIRYEVIKFLKNFCSDGIDEILRMEESLKDKDEKHSFDMSPMQRLLMNGTKNLRAIDKSELVEDIIFTMQFYSKNNEILLPLLDMISNCVLFKGLAQKFCNFGILKDIVKPFLNVDLCYF